jgi:hypothetical protein
LGAQGWKGITGVNEGEAVSLTTFLRARGRRLTAEWCSVGANWWVVPMDRATGFNLRPLATLGEYRAYLTEILGGGDPKDEEGQLARSLAAELRTLLDEWCFGADPSPPLQGRAETRERVC